MDEKILYRIETGLKLGTQDPVIEVYGLPEDGWYEWRIMRDGQIEHDTRQAGYGNPDIALRDALIHVYGLPRDLDQALADRPSGRRSVELAS